MSNADFQRKIIAYGESGGQHCGSLIGQVFGDMPDKTNKPPILPALILRACCSGFLRLSPCRV